MTRTSHVRLALVGVGALLAMLVTIQPGHSQPYPPGPPGGGIRGGPPPAPIGPPGMPGPGQGGIRGGIGGRPGFPDIPRPPEFPRPPEMPRPPDFPTPPGGGIGGIPGPGAGPTEWLCGRCGRRLAIGPV